MWLVLFVGFLQMFSIFLLYTKVNFSLMHILYVRVKLSKIVVTNCVKLDGTVVHHSWCMRYLFHVIILWLFPCLYFVFVFLFFFFVSLLGGLVSIFQGFPFSALILSCFWCLFVDFCVQCLFNICFPFNWVILL